MAGDATPPLPPPKIDPTSHYFLGPQDRPGDYITPTRLKGDNYDEWASGIQLVLKDRRKFGFLDGTITGPVSPCTQSDWNTIQAMIISWILNTIDPEIKGTLSKYKDAKRLWDTLKTRFAVVNDPRIQQLKRSIAKCEQSKNMTVASYFGKLSALWEELNIHEPLINCSCCSNCTAEILHEQRRDASRLHQFLMGLNSAYYSQARSNILSQDSLPSLDRAYQLIVQEERLRPNTLHEEQPPDVVEFAVKTRSRRRQDASSAIEDKTDKSHLFCTHCKKRGHDISSCFELKGYPEWWATRSKSSNGRDSFQGKARGQPPKPQVNATNAAGRGAGTDASEDSSSVFTAAQWKALAGLIGNTTISDNRLNGKLDFSSWIVDTGASRLVTCIDSWLFDIHYISDCPVGLPNGQSIMATKEG